MNLDELRAAQSKERQTDSLQHLRESFYEEAAEYIAELEAERDRAASAVDDPFASPKVRQLTDEIETAREVVEAIYERRLGKLVKSASLAAADIPTDEDGLTMEERALFDDLVERIEANKARVLDVLDDGGDDDPPAPEPDLDRESVEPGRDGSAEPGRDAAASEEVASGEAPSVTDPSDGNRGPTAPDESLASTEAADADGSIEDASATMGEASSREGGRTNGSTETSGSDADGTGAVGTDGAGVHEATPTEEPSTPAEPAEGERSGTGDPATDGSGATRASPTEGTAGGDGTADHGASETGSEPSGDPPASGAGPAGDGSAASDRVDRTTVRVTENVEQFYGLDDREYDLDAEDVVTLPAANAEPLLQRGVAERVE